MENGDFDITKSHGTFERGIFRGIRNDEKNYTKFYLEVVNGESVFTEALDYVPFNPRTGEKKLTIELNDGDIVEVGLWIEARTYVKDGQTKAFAGRSVTSVRKVA